MERLSGLLSWTLSRALWLSGLFERGAARQPRIMEEKALEVYGNFTHGSVWHYSWRCGVTRRRGIMRAGSGDSGCCRILSGTWEAFSPGS